ncbi:hypothetical protein ABTE74_20325, partial [Acinetobacter baumannii]
MITFAVFTSTDEHMVPALDEQPLQPEPQPSVLLLTLLSKGTRAGKRLMQIATILHFADLGIHFSNRKAQAKKSNKIAMRFC